jgi:carbonic anhydrase
VSYLLLFTSGKTDTRCVGRAATSVLAAVKIALDQYKANHVTMVGHSLVSASFRYALNTFKLNMLNFRVRQF